MIGDFEILLPLYRNGQVIIYRAVNSVTKKLAILKTHPTEYPSSKETANLEHEYRLLKKLDIPQVVHAQNLIREKNRLFLVLEEIEGLTLHEFIQKRKLLDLKTFFKIATQLVETLEKIHAQKIIHKDIKPTNILIDPKTLAIKIMDFSLSSEVPTEAASDIEGTLAYISPEQTGRIHRMIDFRSDFYSLGITFYEMLTGHPPFEDKDPLELIFSHLTRPPPPLPSSIPPLLRELIFKLMAKDPEDRYASDQGIRFDLSKISQNQTNFELGQEDVKKTFLISQRLYGREEQIEKILNCFKDFQEIGQNYLLLIQAPAGMGKSALIQEVRKLFPVGRFIKGKFDPLQKMTPFFGLSQAMRELIQYLLNEDEEELNFIKEELRTSLGISGKIITDLDPLIESMLGFFPPLESLPSKEARLRLLFAFQNFFQTFATKDMPIILFLDDLQWADQASLDVLSFLLDNVPHLFAIGAFRDNEIPPNHPLRVMFKEVKRQSSVFLSPLVKKDIAALLQDTLRKEKVEELADFVLSTTAGNPFFVVELIKTLHEQGLIFFSGKEWSFNLASIRELKLSANIVDFMVSRIHKLSSENQKILSLAACIGTSFQLNELSLISEKNTESLGNILWKGLQEGLLISKGSDYKQVKIGYGNIYYQFSHDKVQEAAYSLIPQSERKIVHLQMGRHLLQNKDYQTTLFDILGHYNESLDLISDSQEKRKVAELNLEGAKKAKLSNAYQSSLSFLEAARFLLEKEDLTVETEYAEGLYLVGKFQESEKKLKEIAQKATTKQIKGSAYSLLTLQLCNLGKFKEAITEGCRALHLYNIYFPENPSKLDVFRAIAQFKLQTLFLSKEKLKQDSLAQDPDLLIMGQILDSVCTACYMYNPKLLVIAGLKSMLIGIKYGITSNRPFGIAVYAIWLLSQFRFEEALEWWKVASSDAAKLQNSLLTGQLTFVNAVCISPWFSSWKESQALFLKAQQLCFESGDFVFLTYVHNSLTILTYILGHSINEVREECKKLISILQRSREPGHTDFAFLFESLLKSLQEGEREEEMNRHWKNTLAHPYNNTAKRYTCTLMSTYYFIKGEFQKAWEASKKSSLYKQGTLSHGSINSLNAYFTALIGFALYPSLSKKEKKEAFHAYHLLKIFYEENPQNYAAAYFHTSAELAAIKGDKIQAAQFFDQAIDAAEQEDSFFYAAIISEGAFRFYSKNNHLRIAKSYLQIAYYYYNRWGAFTKTNALEEHYPHWLSSSLSFDSQISHRTISSRSLSNYSLDFLSILKSTQTLSSEIRLDNLLSHLIRIIQENVGADRGILILNEDPELIIKVIGQEDNGLKTNLISIPVSQYPHLPQTLIHYVRHSQKGVVLNYASREGDFTQDPYILEHELKSVICYPISFQNKLIGIIYLENNAITSAFTQERLDIINIFASQAAISIQNSKLYEDLQKFNANLEHLVSERTKETEEALEKLTLMQQQLIQQEKAAALGLITAGVAHEIKNPLNSIINFADLSKEYVEKIKEVIDKHKDTLSSDELNATTDGINFLQLNLERIYNQGIRADSIVRRMSEHAKGRSGHISSVDIYRFLEESIDLFQQEQKVRANSLNLTVQKNFDSSFQSLAISPLDMHSVILNLLNNAYYAVSAKKKVLGDAYTPQIQVTTKNLDQFFEIRVRDNGTGIPKELLDKIFVPFTTTKSVGEGTGLGLSLSNDIVRVQHGGTLTFTSQEGEFTEFVITLPKPKS